MLGREFRRLAQKQFWKHVFVYTVRLIKLWNTTFDAVLKQIGDLYILINGNWPVYSLNLLLSSFYYLTNWWITVVYQLHSFKSRTVHVEEIFKGPS